MKLKFYILFLFMIGIQQLFSQNFFLKSGYTYSFVPNYNDDKGSEYFPEQDYIESVGKSFFTVQIGYQKKINKYIHEIDFGWRKIGVYGKYSNSNRIWYLVPDGKSKILDLDYQIQGMESGLFMLKYNFGKQLSNTFQLMASISGNLAYRSTIYQLGKEKSTSYYEAYWHYESEYFRKFTTTIGTTVNWTPMKWFSFALEYDYFLTPINTKIDFLNIRTYRPHYFTFSLKIHNIN
jgi:hypothetical protein